MERTEGLTGTMISSATATEHINAVQKTKIDLMNAIFNFWLIAVFQIYERIVEHVVRSD